jgi:UDP-4-amino-4,6-dideoxy-N-acetyl-beta-L-altrosamine N-acetyltransferase
VLRAALDTDRDAVLDWRNHPEVRRVSLTTHVIGADEHRAWWKRAADDPARRVLIFEHDGVPAGVVIFSDIDPREKSATWGFYLDVAGLTRAGTLLPAWLRLEAQVVAYAFGELGLDRLGGETLASNTQVLALHRRFGFTETRRYTRPVDGIPQDVIWTERGRA